MTFRFDVHYLQRLNLPGSSLLADLGTEQVDLSQPATEEFPQDYVTFDYMGDATFERGKVPQSLARMIKNRSDLAIGVTALDVPIEGWNDPRYEDALKKQYPDGKTIQAFIIASQDMLDDATLLALDLPAPRDHYLPRIAIRIETGVYKDEITKIKKERDDILALDATVGWLDINNDFMIFTDQNMFNFFKNDVFRLN